MKTKLFLIAFFPLLFLSCSLFSKDDSSESAENSSTKVKTYSLNGTDIKALREKIKEGELDTLDWSNAKIVSGGESYYTDTSNKEYYTKDDTIGDWMFVECENLKKITIPDSIKTIESYAFKWSGLTEIEIPDSVTYLGRDAFARCYSMEKAVIGSKVSALAQGVFWMSNALTDVYVKAGTPPTLASLIFTSNPVIHVYAEALNDYKESDWNSYGTIVGGLEEIYPLEKNSVLSIRPLLPEFFSDNACTKLKSEYSGMSDKNLSKAMRSAGLPDSMIQIALKIKNENWADYEKDFRIHDYRAYSDANYWNGKMKSTGGSYMGNPTGIYSGDESQIYVFVEDEIPSSSTLYFAGLTGNTLIGNAKTGKKLSQGLNIINGQKDALYYVIYTADTSEKAKKLSEWPTLKIHVEGGIVNGYYEPEIHSESDYKAILANATHELFTVKGKEALFNFKTSTYRTYWPEKIAESIGWFDSLTVWEKELMGICESVANGERSGEPYFLTGGEAVFPSYYNNPNFAIEGSSSDPGVANSSTYRTSYNSPGCAYQSFDITNTNHDDWCAAHECGHNNQGAINLEACTEVSNNLFSNVVRFLTGNRLSRGLTVTDAMDAYASDTPFFTRNIWSMTRMYYQLYLYYHQAQKNTSFYPELFKTLREDSLALWNDTNESSLKFVRKVCAVANEDLTDFFTAWGFFVPCSETISDYGNKSLTVNQEDINETLKEISQYPKKNISILFIEDRVKPVLKADGTERRASEDAASVKQKYGNLAHFTDYLENSQSSYSYIKNDREVKMTGTGGVGFIVKDSSGKMLYASNLLNFTLPETVGEDFKIYSVDSDSTLHEATESSE